MLSLLWNSRGLCLCPRVPRAGCFPLASAPDSGGAGTAREHSPWMHQSEQQRQQVPRGSEGRRPCSCAIPGPSEGGTGERGDGERGDGNHTGPCGRARPRTEDLTAQLLTSQPCRPAPPPFPFHRRGARVKQRVTSPHLSTVR